MTSRDAPEDVPPAWTCAMPDCSREVPDAPARRDPGGLCAVHADDVAEVEIPVTGDAVGVRTTRRSVVIGRAVTPAKRPDLLFSIDDARSGESPGDLSPLCETYSRPSVGQDMTVSGIYSGRGRWGGGVYDLGKVTAIESGALVDPHDLFEDDAPSSLAVNL